MSSEVLAENRVAITQQVTRELLERERVAQLLAGPLGGRVMGHVEVKNAATIMSQYQKHVRTRNRIVGTVKKSIETSCERWLSRNVRQV